MLKNTPENTLKAISYGIHDCQLGRVVLAKSDKGLCWLGFMVSKEQGAYKGDGLTRMKEHFTGSEFVEDHEGTKSLLNEVLKAWKDDRLKDIALDLKGSVFQCAVWEAMLDIPKGTTVTYGDIANDICRPKAYRAVGTAVGENPVSLIVPCHRVIQKSGNLGNYGWGLDLKEKLLHLEAS